MYLFIIQGYPKLGAFPNMQMMTRDLHQRGYPLDAWIHHLSGTTEFSELAKKKKENYLEKGKLFYVLAKGIPIFLDPLRKGKLQRGPTR